MKKLFVSYNRDGFDNECHEILFNNLKKLRCKFLLSNSNIEYLKNEFKDYK